MTEINPQNTSETNAPNTQAAPVEAVEAEVAQRSSRRTFLMVALGLGGVALLGGAAYAAGKLMTPANPAMGGNKGGENIAIAGQGGTQVLKMPPIKPAPEIPELEPDVQGVYLNRKDQSIFVGTGNVSISMMSDSSGKSDADATHDGPDVEVVVNHNTKIYVDKTPITVEAMKEGKELQQVVETIASLDDLTDKLSKTDTLTIWGNKVGDRVVARIILYRQPMVFKGG
jgi:hypothetical protein